MTENYVRLTKPKLFNLISERYGVNLPKRTLKADIISWIKRKEAEQPSPNIGVSLPTRPSPLPNISLPARPSPLPTISCPLPIIDNIAVSPKLPSPSINLQAPVKVDIIPGFSQSLPTPTVSKPVLSGPTLVFPEGRIDAELLTELPDISGPPIAVNPMKIITPAQMGQILIPSVPLKAPKPSVFAASAIKLPSFLPPQIIQEKVETLNLPPLFQPAPINKMGPGGLAIQTDLSTLEEVRNTEILLINPQAAFQEKIPASQSFDLSLTGIKIKEIPAIPSSSSLTAPIKLSLSNARDTSEIKLEPLLLSTPKTPTASLLASPSRVKPAIIIPRTPIETRKIGINVPITKTTIAPIPLASPILLASKRAVSPISAVAYTSAQHVLQNLSNIDPVKLSVDRSRSDESYTLPQLRAIAISINLPKSGSKKDLVTRIKAAISKK